MFKTYRVKDNKHLLGKSKVATPAKDGVYRCAQVETVETSRLVYRRSRIHETIIT
jgi:hypothetical protein